MTQVFMSQVALYQQILLAAIFNNYAKIIEKERIKNLAFKNNLILFTITGNKKDWHKSL